MHKTIKKYSKKIYDGTIVLLSNVYGRTQHIGNSKLNIKAEFFSEQEFEYILTSLKECHYNVICYFDENKFILDYLSGKFDHSEFLVFNLARNGYGIGKKSLIPTFCDLNNIKYTASDGYACSFARSKYHVNALLKYLELNELESYIYKGKWLNKYPTNENQTYIVKPLFESASQGISNNSIYYANCNISLNNFVNDIYVKLNNSPLLVQKFIEGYEAKITIIEFDKPYALPPIGVEINGKHDLQDDIISEEIAFNYSHKNYLIKDEFGEIFSNKLSEQALSIYTNIGMQNYGRIDCRIDRKTKEIYFMDFSTMPYFVSNGEMLFAFDSLKEDIHGLLNAIINSALISKYNYSL